MKEKFILTGLIAVSILLYGNFKVDAVEATNEGIEFPINSIGGYFEPTPGETSKNNRWSFCFYRNKTLSFVVDINDNHLLVKNKHIIFKAPLSKEELVQIIRFLLSVKMEMQKAESGKKSGAQMSTSIGGSFESTPEVTSENNRWSIHFYANTKTVSISSDINDDHLLVNNKPLWLNTPIPAEELERVINYLLHCKSSM